MDSERPAIMSEMWRDVHHYPTCLLFSYQDKEIMYVKIFSSGKVIVNRKFSHEQCSEIRQNQLRTRTCGCSHRSFVQCSHNCLSLPTPSRVNPSLHKYRNAALQFLPIITGSPYGSVGVLSPSPAVQKIENSIISGVLSYAPWGTSLIVLCLRGP